METRVESDGHGSDQFFCAHLLMIYHNKPFGVYEQEFLNQSINK